MKNLVCAGEGCVKFGNKIVDTNMYQTHIYIRHIDMAGHTQVKLVSAVSFQALVAHTLVSAVQ